MAIEISTELAERLIKEQFPDWSNFPVYPVAKSGHDNRTFHLGSEMSIRLPSGADYAPQIEKELFWLPKLKPHLSLPIACPLAKGEPASYYPFSWSINQWLAGDMANHHNVINHAQFAADLAAFLKQLQAIEASNGSAAGRHNFYRGGALSIYHEETQMALAALKGKLRTEKLNTIWSLALESEWDKENVWVHGDVAPGNLLVRDGKLSAVIDFGMLGVGDPACDYTMAWTFFNKQSREIFFRMLGCDEDTQNRARGWALWKALITYHEKDLAIAANAKYTIDAILEE